MLMVTEALITLSLMIREPTPFDILRLFHNLFQRGMGHQYNKLFAAIPGEDIFLSELLHDECRDFLEHQIAKRCPWVSLNFLWSISNMRRDRS